MSITSTTNTPYDLSPRGQTASLSVAPMMAYTDRHFRYVLRQLSRETLLYTEMVTANAIIHGDRDRLIGFSEAEHPVALQLGGDDPVALARCAVIAEDRGYDEVNLNVGCPSDRVQSGSFGASLMARPEHVGRCVAAMREAVAIPVTVKHRIGIDELDSYEHMSRFVSIVSAAGCDRFTVHARKAWLKGLSPKENRNIPPLRYADVYRLKADFPQLSIEINGGIKTLDETVGHLAHVDAVMIGRAAVDDLWLFSKADTAVFHAATDPYGDRFGFVEGLYPYIGAMAERGERLLRMSRHLMHLFAGLPGARAWRRTLSQGPDALGSEAVAVLRRGLQLVREAQETAALNRRAYSGMPSS